jgi:WS/DGAT/MGAT family acyltransferase
MGSESRLAVVSPVDAAWLRMDSETNPMVVTSLLRLDGPLEPSALADLVARVATSTRFHQRIASAPLTFGRAHWRDDPDFDVSRHVHRVALPAGPSDGSGLLQLVGHIMSQPLDRSRPLWEVHVLDGVRQPIGDGTALLVRTHHCLGDGAALVRMLLDLAGQGGGAPAAAPRPVGASRASLPRRPAHVADVARIAALSAGALLKLTLLPFDDGTPLRGKQSRAKRVGWSRPYPLERVKETAHRLGAKVNDVLLASVTAAVRRYLVRRGAMRPRLELHALVPVLLPETMADPRYGNHFGLAFVGLPLSIGGPIDRVYEMKRRMEAMKASPEPRVTFGVLAASGLLGAATERLAVRFFSRKGSLLATNVAGPTAPLHLGARKIESITVWAPVAGSIAVSISLLSYAGVLRMAVASDAAVVPEPQAIAEAFCEDLTTLVG